MASTFKSSEAVVEVIRNYMEERCASDPILAIKYANPAKSIEKALNYVAHEVQKSGLTIMDSESVFGLILHYYDENLEDVPNVNCNIAVAKELTDNEKAEVKEQAKERYREEQLRELRRQNQPKPKAKATAPKAGTEINVEPNLFGDDF
ncbi:Cas9 inhibitor AcrIIA9 family protein [uncultured Muribaculum sp.]|uniref:PcfK-like family protein n=1 Tax=uncultured Muribaculum sp. TaxID=1918613 RepID=UPI002730AFA5|nr:Cas9 inhibitor AcrIIA9 family protein [uncultured Muribaculum sp.]